MNQSDPAALPDDDVAAVEAVVAAAAHAGRTLAAASRQDRAELLEAMAADLAGATHRLARLADGETHLGAAVLEAEVERTCGQLRLFAGVLRDGGYLEVATDGDGGPDSQRRILLPLGVTAVFGSSNFPFAYGVAGGDTASALAAGCAVVVKEHPSHPATCRAVLEVMRDASERVGLPRQVISLVRGFQAGQALVTAADVRAVGFTGSVSGGRALFDLCAARPDPIAFHGELGSLNPVVVTPGAATGRPTEIGAMLAESITRRGGQMCTKPGLVFVPAGSAGDAAVEVLAADVSAGSGVTLLNEAVRGNYESGTRSLASVPGIVVRAGELPGEASQVRPLLFETTISAADGADLHEVFGPVAVVLRYTSIPEIVGAIGDLDAALVAAVHAEPDEQQTVADLVAGLTPLVGRLVWGAPTTGLPVGWATHHGGGYPASTSTHTSVGASAIRRWLRPISFQGFPSEYLPPDLAATDVPRRVDGVLVN